MSVEAGKRPPGIRPRLAAGYQPRGEVYDELLSPDGHLRPHWRAFLGSLSQSTRTEISQREESARRLLREHGATYNVYAEGESQTRPWRLDLLPLLLSADEWRRIAAGVTQRCRLLNLLLADLYGPQRALKEGLLPPAMLHANPAFLPPCHGIVPPRGVYLHRHAVDLARSPDGRWWVLADRAQAPSGAGYALENRVVLSRLLPNEFYVSQVEQIAPFFEAERNCLRQLAPEPDGEPNVVLLTPGPRNETYFEHSFLARHLDCALVEGEDLTVRDERVYVKTLDGLQQVDVILRRVDEHYCDPLELDAESRLGVPGLVQAARAGKVAILNALGSGAVEVGALLAFIPALCRAFLGEEPLLPSLATWWCGQEKERSYVLDHLDALVVKPAFPGTGRQPIFGADLDAGGREALRRAVRFNPAAYVGQERVALSTTPVWVDDRLEPRPLVLRVFVSYSGDRFEVLPGGLTRVAPERDAPVVSSQSGGSSKDTWILAGPGQRTTPRTALGPLRRSRGKPPTPAEIPSRVADNLFWLGRYAERLEDTARTLRCALSRLADESGIEETPELLGLVDLLVHFDLLPAAFREDWRPGAVERELLRLVFRSDRLGTVQELRYRLNQTGFVVRDRLSPDTLRVLERIDTDAGVRPGRNPLHFSLAVLNTLLLNLAALSGMEMENMVRGHGWRFMELGRRLERAVNIISLVQGGLLIEENNRGVLQPMLEIADSTMTYRRLHFAQPVLGPVLELLLFTARNPRALVFQLELLRLHVGDLPGNGGSQTSLIEQADGALTQLKGIETAGRWAAVQRATRRELSDQLGALADRLRQVSTGISQRYFMHLAHQTAASP
ncbi:MAG: circularly permuted type 2 ATP-grasp protein [Verrucomicrobiales bacterium]|nr:circularly permuted type 2 ATP-grasp protein [Verrucomicrobiales bacterium]